MEITQQIPHRTFPVAANAEPTVHQTRISTLSCLLTLDNGVVRAAMEEKASIVPAVHFVVLDGYIVAPL